MEGGPRLNHRVVGSVNAAAPTPRAGGQGQPCAVFPRGWLVVVLRRLAELGQPAGLHLADALPGEIHDGAHLFERDASFFGDVQRAGVLQLPNLLVREVELDGARFGVYVEVEVVFAGDEEAGPRSVDAFGARSWAAFLRCSSGARPLPVPIRRPDAAAVGLAPSPFWTWFSTAAALGWAPSSGALPGPALHSLHSWVPSSNSLQVSARVPR